MPIPGLRWAALAVATTLALGQASALETLPPLVNAAKRGDHAAAMQLIGQHVAVDDTEADGTTALLWAARSGDRELVAALLRAGANAKAANRYGMTALHIAAINGDAETVRLLLKAGADPNAALPEGETVLLSAARTGAADVITALVKAGAKMDARENWYGETPLIWAAAENHPEAVRTLLSLGADPNIRSAPEKWEKRRASQSLLSLGEWTPLFYAARSNALETGKVLIKGGANLNLADPDGATALVIAIINAHYEFAQLLIDAGADPNIVDTSGMGALYAAVDMHRLAVGHGRPNPKPVGTLTSADIVKALLAHGANPNAELTSPIIQRQHTFGDFTLGKGATPLLRAAKSGDIELVKMLVGAGADVKHTMPNGATALMYAAGLGWRNGSPIAPSFDQGTDAEAVETIAYLMKQGLSLGAQDKDGNTALHAAIMGRASDMIITYLVKDAGADLTVRNAKGQTPLGAAEAKRNGEAVVTLLHSLGVNEPVASTR
ncbi:MAG TPA: ankyrin repeat domain-containing protein [Gammaproteobacteria bacterium]|jgi:ankyrin repeat protein|nr:ankyrin repeat domain-containing protein [Gammaproteobacteria bacterium]